MKEAVEREQEGGGTDREGEGWREGRRAGGRRGWQIHQNAKESGRHRASIDGRIDGRSRGWEGVGQEGPDVAEMVDAFLKTISLHAMF